MHRILFSLTFPLVLAYFSTSAQVRELDGFESKEGWSFNVSDGVSVNMSMEEGITGNAIRFDYEFTKGTGYGGIQKWFPIDLPENFEFSFYLKADSPGNNFEIKFIDSTGNNVWWVNNRNYDFPEDWKKIRIKKRHIGFAWGPTPDQSLKRFDRIEITIASYVGGKGTIWLDDLKFEALPPEADMYPDPVISASSSTKEHQAENMTDHDPETSWKSKGSRTQQILVDFRTRREFGGVQIAWNKDHHALSFDVVISEDGKSWEKVYSVARNQGETSFIRLPETEAKYLRLNLNECSSEEGFGISELKFLDIRNSMTPNDFLIYAAKNSPHGNYPRYFLEQASFWTVSGVNNDVKEAMINEDGMVEVDKGLFSIEPVIRIGDSVYNWANASPGQSLGFDENTGEFAFIPTVTLNLDEIKFAVSIESSGEANASSMLDIRYAFENTSGHSLDFGFYLLIRPFQVNPYYQWLNLTGGVGRINSIKEDAERPGQIICVDEKVVVSTVPWDGFGAMSFDEGNPMEFLQKGMMPSAKTASDRHGLAGGIVKYDLHLGPGSQDQILVSVPFYGREGTDRLFSGEVYTGFANAAEFWKEKTDHVKFNLPPSANRIIYAYKANLAYILINRDRVGIQPGSRSYERSWIRDGALTSSALLKNGIVDEVKDFIDWYAAHQYENGKVPCVVDFRGPDPVPEHDSHGEMIYLIREYFNFTRDTAFLKSKNQNVIKAVNYIESLIAERSTDHYKYGNDSVRAYFGLVPESISHEGYSAKPMHSYWDNFFIMKGLKDAADIQQILGEQANYDRICLIRDTFRENLYNSLDLAIKYKKIDYIPGCVELGDFDATSTTIALTPCNELKNLPKPQVYRTFDKYYEFFRNRRDSKLDWVNYTPYENRLIGSFIILDQPERAHELIEFFLDDQRPGGFHHWAEVVWKEYWKPGFIGDMPHTWCGSDFLNAVRSMFVYENEYDQSLVLAAALYQDWIDAPGGMSVENLPTYYGEISYTVEKEGDHYRFSIRGELDLPSNGIRIKNFNGSQLPSKVLVDGLEINDYNEREINIEQSPVEVLIFY